MKSSLLALLGLATLVSAPALAVGQTKPKGEKPADSPGWVVVDDEVWTPLRFEPIESLDSIRDHYRRNELKSAASEIDKAISWLRLAEGHAMPIALGNFARLFNVSSRELPVSDGIATTEPTGAGPVVPPDSSVDPRAGWKGRRGAIPESQSGWSSRSEMNAM